MSIEDINYLKENSIRQTYTFLVDSKIRNRKLYPNPSEYAVEFTVPFKNVIGLEVVDVSVPKTMYNIDVNNNKLYYVIVDSEDDNYITFMDDAPYYDTSVFKYIEIPPGDYKTSDFLETFRTILYTVEPSLEIIAVDSPPELTNKIYFRSEKPFMLDMQRSTIAEVLGFDTFANSKESDEGKYKYVKYNDREGFEKIYHSVKNSAGFYVIYAPGMVYLLGYRYLVLKCPEIEQHLYRSLSYSKYNLGLAKIRINSYGYNDEKTTFLQIPVREFHPIGKLGRITLRFETDTGDLYDFKGVNHNIVFVIYYYEPRQDNVVKSSILNPEYNPNFVNYLYKHQEQEGESDDDAEDYSRDNNIQLFKKNEQLYRSSAIDNANKQIAYKNAQKKEEQLSLLNKLQKKVQTSSEDSEDSDDFISDESE